MFLYFVIAIFSVTAGATGTNLHEFHEQDLKRVRDDDVWLSRFLKSRKQDVNNALLALVFTCVILDKFFPEFNCVFPPTNGYHLYLVKPNGGGRGKEGGKVPCLLWRKSFGVNDLTERSIDRRLFESGFLFQHNQDKEGNSMVIFTGKLYKKDPQQQQEIKRYLVFLLEKHVRLFPNRKITMIMDMQETGISQMDMDFVKCVIHCFRDHFPWTLAWLLIVDLPWIFLAAWKIVNTWLSPDAVNKIRFLSKADLADIVDEDKLLQRLGGTDNYEYSYPPSKDPLTERVGIDGVEEVPTSNGFSQENQDSDDDDDDDNEKTEVAENQPQSQISEEREAPVSPTKRVTFEDAPSTAITTNNKQESSTKPPTRLTTQSRLSQKRAPPDGFVSKPMLLTITPPEELLFSGTTSTGEILQSLSLTNNTSSTVAFKVKTTSPESYRVRPSSGVILASSSATVNVFLQPGHAASVIRDKFLVMSTELRDQKSPSELAALWKTVPKTDVIEHRLRCRFVASSSQISSQYYDIAEGKPISLARRYE
ncbi:Motile sperm domain-containing protein 2 [Acropora cervicornis]|uniref:Motile sperm domain-containing protein 2 n=1 Tax=Acropora cervicornis TaxID=6130 RepID=A0AAD9Q840_ACRCE|nr:Motile sperm domain-containing protein 2 [Acropora cervicornis]